MAREVKQRAGDRHEGVGAQPRRWNFTLRDTGGQVSVEVR